MLRSGAPRAAFRALNSSPLTTRAPFLSTKTGTILESRLTTLANGRPMSLSKPLSMALARFHSNTRVLQDKIDHEHERKFAQKKLSAHPEFVSETSSTHPLFEEVATPKEEPDTDMMAGVRSDIKTIRDTFSLQDVPREAYYVGMAGVLPYLATSVSTIFCAYEVNLASTAGSGLFLSGRTAEALLHIIEPLQIGYGAVIISFLGAIHWGLEFAGYGGHQGYSRYAIGVVAPAVAWPTIFFPAETALIAQFLAFNFLYYTDSRATQRGWAPPWYSVYRFVLTFIVGASIVATLIGRGQIIDQIGKLPAPADRIRALRAAQAEELEKEEEARRKKTVEDEEGDDE
ncbi:Transmembrane protein 69 [Sphaceloma murrayae]|uniref:Transmembrane protein 69 n=1 Tax=Sphaceloma murrayae TaxID=2082308 RepID=A0A2K1QMP3_9PEZI|nr:Transmembrane protein 69 [Sphaceloma murrayae]